MKRGFLNTPRAKRVIEDVYAPQPPPIPESSPQGKSSSPPRRAQDEGEAATAAEDAMDVEITAPGGVSNGGNRVIATRTTRSTEGETELPSLDDDNETKAEPPSGDPIDKGKGKAKAVDTGDDVTRAEVAEGSSLPPRPLPRRSGWGRDPDEAFFHTVPPSHGGPHTKRAVFRLWPRDPKGKVLMPSEKPRGTLSPDGYPWGATLYDFFHVNRVPTNCHATTIMTGSALLEAMKQLGELDVAAPEIEWVKSEGKPRVEGVVKTEVLIECTEGRVHLGAYGNFSAKRDEEHKEDLVEKAAEGDGGDEDHDGEEEEAPEDGDEEEDKSDVEYDDVEVDPASIPPPPTIPVASPFHPSHYPKPWPITPFEGPLSVLLQERIPLYLLPQTLYVHDPFSLLPARERRFRDTSWTSRPDVIRTYHLKLSTSIRKEVAETKRKAEELEEFKARTLIILRYKRTKEQIENHEPAIEVPLPPYPRRMKKVEESHLYLSPVAKAGQGHHSIVYKGEWELPRDLFTKPKLCRECFKEAADKEIQRLKDTGRWEKMLKAAGWGPTGSTGRQPTQAELDHVSDAINLERDGEIVEREITCIVVPDASPSHIFELIDESSLWETLMERSNAKAVHLNFAGDGGESTKGSHVATIRIDPPVSYESQKTCTHDPCHEAIPRTAKFTVVAKLSIENDHHLAREASNYQRFPEHFFHHYNGYTVINQLHAIVPVNAVVPQFYGYYTPAKDEGEKPYLSPILLLEHCGEPINPEDLSVEDQDECASLLLRMQRAGWLHESVAPRNFLVQLGKPTEFPFMQRHKLEPSFRLIDFGRSRKFEKAEEKRAEEMEALRMLQKLNGKMNVTLSM